MKKVNRKIHEKNFFKSHSSEITKNKNNVIYYTTNSFDLQHIKPRHFNFVAINEKIVEMYF